MREGGSLHSGFQLGLQVGGRAVRVCLGDSKGVGVHLQCAEAEEVSLLMRAVHPGMDE